MLIITGFEGSASTSTLKLEGKLVGPWIVELESAFDGTRVVACSGFVAELLHHVGP